MFPIKIVLFRSCKSVNKLEVLAMRNKHFFAEVVFLPNLVFLFTDLQDLKRTIYIENTKCNNISSLLHTSSLKEHFKIQKRNIKAKQNKWKEKIIQDIKNRLHLGANYYLSIYLAGEHENRILEEFSKIIYSCRNFSLLILVTT